MNPDVKEKWLKALESGDYKHVAHRLRCGDMFCAIGVLCDLHSKETGKEWFKDALYLNEIIVAPKDVLEWAGITASQQSNIIIANGLYDGNTATYKFAIEYIREKL